MTLNDLKTGMIVTLRNNQQYAVIRDMFISIRDNYSIFVRADSNGDREWMDFNGYKSDLTHSSLDHAWDIVKVEKPNHPFGFIDLTFKPECRTILWEEKKTVKLTVAEIEARLGYKVEIVSEEE